MICSINIPDFMKNQQINTDYLCKNHNGKNIFPYIYWNCNHNKNNKNNNKNIFRSLIMEDPDAPTGTFVHWYIPYIPENIYKINEKTISSIFIGYNSLQQKSYFGPCNPENKNHQYIFYLYTINGDFNKLNDNKKVDFIKTNSSIQYEKILKNNNFKIIDKQEKKFLYKKL